MNYSIINGLSKLVILASKVHLRLVLLIESQLPQISGALSWQIKLLFLPKCWQIVTTVTYFYIVHLCKL